MRPDLRVRVEVDEPFELVSDTDKGVSILGHVRVEDSSLDELVIQADEGFTLAGSLVLAIVVTPRHVGDRFDSLLLDRKIFVNAWAETEGEDIHFAEVVLPLPEIP
jgi:hypothetical protein